MLSELFSLGVTAETLQANIDWNLEVDVFEGVGQFRPIFT